MVDEWDVLAVTVANEGFGQARYLQIAIEGPLLPTASARFLAAAGESRSIEIAFRPENVGRAVPITIKVDYEDERGERIALQSPSV